jgi:hypothetical protein
MNERLNGSSVLAVVCPTQLLHRPRALSRGVLTLGATLATSLIGGGGFQLKIEKVFKRVKLRVSWQSFNDTFRQEQDSSL